jgi:hypothetical protein
MCVHFPDTLHGASIDDPLAGLYSLKRILVSGSDHTVPRDAVFLRIRMWSSHQPSIDPLIVTVTSTSSRLGGVIRTLSWGEGSCKLAGCFEGSISIGFTPDGGLKRGIIVGLPLSVYIGIAPDSVQLLKLTRPCL